MSTNQLPDRPHLEQLKKQAKDLLKAYRADAPDAIQAFRAHAREASEPDAKLTDAQFVLARTYGFESWQRLRQHVIGDQLRAAIWNKDTDAIRRAIDAEPDAIHDSGPHPRWGGQPTPLQIAAERGDTSIVRLLLDAGADPNTGTDGYGWSPLQLAAHWGHTDAVDLLTQHGADVDIFSASLLGRADTVAKLLSEDPARAVTPGLNDAPPLHVATTPEVARTLVEAGAALSDLDTYGNTPLGAALSSKRLDVAELLVDLGAACDPCQMAAMGRREALESAIDRNPDAVSRRGKIGIMAVEGEPLHAASAHDRPDIVAVLLERGADPNARASVGQTPLHLCRSPETARLLVEAGADVSAVDDEHHTTALAWARISVDIHGSSPERDALVAYLETVTDASE